MAPSRPRKRRTSARLWQNSTKGAHLESSLYTARMIDRFRNWLAGVIATAPIATEPPEPAPKRLPKARPSMAAAPVADEAPSDEELKKAQQRLREVEIRAQKADERAKRADVARGELEASTKTVEARVTAALERAKRAEQSLKKALDENARTGKKRRGKNDSGEQQLRAAEERARGAADRARAAESKLDDAESRAQSSEKRARELTAKVSELEKRPLPVPAPSAEPPARESMAGAAPRELGRDRVRTATTMEVCFSPGDECLQAIRKLFGQAERTVDVCVFTITDDRIASAIIEAHQRGVRVRIITDNDKAHDEGSDVRRLEAAGMSVREDRTECHMHHKFAIFDGRTVLTGSYNWTRGAARNNEENLVVSNDFRMVGPFEREFNALWGRLARE